MLESWTLQISQPLNFDFFATSLQVHDAVLEEIRKINQLLIFTLVKKSDEYADSIAAKSEAGDTIIKCSFMTTEVSVCFDTNSELLKVTEVPSFFFS